jgi:predicted Zn-dependent peptidase
MDEQRQPFAGYTPQNKEVNRETFQVHYILGGLAYSADHKHKTGLVLLNNLLGGPAMNSRLNLHIRERHGIAYNIESGYQPYSDTGMFHIYLGTDLRLFNKARRLVDAELRRLRENKLGTAQLHMAKQQLIGQIALGQESGSGTMLALGKSYLMYNRVDTLEEVYKSIEAVSAEELLEIANDVLDPSKLSSLTYLPR